MTWLLGYARCLKSKDWHFALSKLHIMGVNSGSV